MTRLPNGYSPNGYSSNGEFSRHFAQSLLPAMEKKYGVLISAARKDWERRFAGRDPADACVSVRISAGESYEEPSREFTLELNRMREPSMMT